MNEIQTPFNAEMTCFTGLDINADEMMKLQKANGNVVKAYKEAQIHRTGVELETSVLNDIKHPTADEKFWHIHRDLKVFANELMMLKFTAKEKEITIREIEFMLEDAEGFEKERFELELEKEKFLMLDLTNCAKDKIREIDNMSNKMDELKDQLVYSDTDIEEHQLYSYMIRYAREWRTVKENQQHGGVQNFGEIMNVIGHFETTWRIIAQDQERFQKLLETIPRDVFEFLVQEKKIIQNKEAS